MVTISLERGADKVVAYCGGAQPGELVVVVTDAERPGKVATALMDAATMLGAKAELQVIPSDGLAGGEPPPPVAARIIRADLVIFATTRIMFYSEAAHRARARGARVITLTGCDVRTLTEGGIEVDFRAQRAACDEVCRALTGAKQAIVTSPGGTRLHFDLTQREATANYGFCEGPGSASGVPDIEAYIAPVEGSCKGTLVIDGSTSVTGLVDDPIVLEVANGHVITISGSRSADVLCSRLQAAEDPNAYIVAEFAIGLNPCARVVGNIIEDEGAYGTGHFALGDNRRFGGATHCSQHVDMVYFKPTILLDGTALMEAGRLAAGTRVVQRRQC